MDVIERTLRKLGVLSLLTVVLVGCDNLERRAPGPVDAEPPPVPVARSSPPPGIAGVGTCVIAPDLDPCLWLATADAVVFGRIISTTMVDSPAYADHDGYSFTLKMGCGDAGGPPALQIVLEPYWAVGAPVPERLDIRIGHGHLDRWSPRPSRATEGSWATSSSDPTDVVWAWPPFADKGLYPGDWVGLPVVELAELGFWSPMGDPLFTLVEGADGAIVIAVQPRHPEGCWGTPAALDGLPLDQGRAVLEACGDAYAAEGAARRLDPLQIPDRYLGSCYKSPDAVVECNVDTECAAGQWCADLGFCLDGTRPVAEEPAQPTRSYWCDTDADCRAAEYCEPTQGFCAPAQEGTPCHTDADCAANELCEPAFLQCMPRE